MRIAEYVFGKGRAVGNYYILVMRASKKAIDGAPSLTRELTVVNKLGIHARPAAMFVKIANQFDGEVLVEKDGEQVNGKSIMGLMMLAAGPGSRLTVRATGTGAPELLEELERLVRRRFDEE